MLLSRAEFLDCDDLIAICGIYCGGDAVHVGIAYKDPDLGPKIFHFQRPTLIPVEDLNDAVFTNYRFNPISFLNGRVASFSALADLIQANKINNFAFRVDGSVYNGGSFDFNGGTFITGRPIERIVNCAIFVVGLLKTYRYSLIQWDTWPLSANNILRGDPYLSQWFVTNRIPTEDQEEYYRTARAVRGKHVIVAPLTETKPSPYSETDPLAAQFVTFLSNR